MSELIKAVHVSNSVRYFVTGIRLLSPGTPFTKLPFSIFLLASLNQASSFGKSGVSDWNSFFISSYLFFTSVCMMSAAQWSNGGFLWRRGRSRGPSSSDLWKSESRSPMSTSPSSSLVSVGSCCPTVSSGSGSSGVRARCFLFFLFFLLLGMFL